VLASIAIAVYASRTVPGQHRLEHLSNWGLVAALQIANLWLGLYNAHGEWPWTYFFLLVIQLTVAVHRYGRSLGLDAVAAARSPIRAPPAGSCSRRRPEEEPVGPRRSVALGGAERQ
jgi:hypothetical protein